jgi:hypothetical protein
MAHLTAARLPASAFADLPASEAVLCWSLDGQHIHASWSECLPGDVWARRSAVLHANEGDPLLVWGDEMDEDTYDELVSDLRRLARGEQTRWRS